MQAASGRNASDADLLGRRGGCLGHLWQTQAAPETECGVAKGQAFVIAIGAP
jgi:hypothetical protein